MITVVDVTSFSQCSRRRYKQIPIASAVPSEPCTEYSRYEVLQQKIRKMYFDFDGVPEDQFSLFREFVEDYNNYLIDKDYIKSPIEFVITTNSRSTNHPGLGSHIIAKSTTMDVSKQHTLLLGFLTEFPGAVKYKEYVDVSVYSSLQLFKLPHFIGLPMTDTENYHCMLSPEDPTDYIIQNTAKSTYINPSIECKQEWKKAGKRISWIPRRKDTQIKDLVDALLGHRSTKHIDVHKYIDRCQELMLSEHITEALTKRLTAIIDDLRENKNVEMCIGLIDHIADKINRNH